MPEAFEWLGREVARFSPPSPPSLPTSPASVSIAIGDLASGRSLATTSSSATTPSPTPSVSLPSISSPSIGPSDATSSTTNLSNHPDLPLAIQSSTVSVSLNANLAGISAGFGGGGGGGNAATVTAESGGGSDEVICPVVQ